MEGIRSKYLNFISRSQKSLRPLISLYKSQSRRIIRENSNRILNFASFTNFPFCQIPTVLSKPKLIKELIRPSMSMQNNYCRRITPQQISLSIEETDESVKDKPKDKKLQNKKCILSSKHVYIYY